MADDIYRFMTAEDYFTPDGWHHVTDVTDVKVWDDRTVALTVALSDPDLPPATLLLQFPRRDVVRVRFNPAKRERCDYADDTPRSRAGAVARARAAQVPGGVRVGVGLDHVQIRTFADDAPYLMVRVERHPFALQVWRELPGGAMLPVVADAETPLRFRYSGDPLLGHQVMQVRTRSVDARYTGFGEHGGADLFKDTARHTFFNYDNYRGTKVYGQGPLDPREPLYHSATFFLELNVVPGRELACGVFVDTPGQALVDLGTCCPDEVRVGTRSGDLDHYLFVGDTPQQVLHRYSQLVDRSALKPRWALGYHQGCYGYDSRAALEYAVATYRDPRLGMPLDGLHIDVDVQREHQTFTVDDRDGRFPDPRGMFASLRAQGVKCSTNITPVVSNRDPGYEVYASGVEKGVFVADRRVPGSTRAEHYQQYGRDWPAEGALRDSAFDSGLPYVGEVNYGGENGTTGHYPDLGRPEVRAWWGAQYRHLFDLGLEMVWQDMTTPAIRDTRGDMLGFPFRLLLTDDSDGDPRPAPALAVWNHYSYNLHKATYEGLNALPGRENRRAFVVGRGSTSGTARYAALWTGDNASTWDFLRVALQQMLALGVCGQPLAGADVGGFETGSDGERWADPALLARWTAAGAFFPWFRNHYTRKGGKWFQEPWGYQKLLENGHCPPGQERLYAAVLPVCQYYVQLRYRLLQVFYDAMFANLGSGQPICRLLSLVHPHDTSLYAENLPFQSTQFMLGDDLLVAPVLEPEHVGGGRRDVYLPTGTDWYAFADGRPLGGAVPGGTTVSFDAHLSDDPDHVPSVVPLYVRAGAVLPVLEVEQWVGQRREQGLDHPLTYTVHPGATGRCTSYLDDGVSRSSAPEGDPLLGDDPAARGEHRQVTVQHRRDVRGQRRFVDVHRDHDGWTPRETYFHVCLLHDPAEPGPAQGLPDGPLAQVGRDGRVLQHCPDAPAALAAARTGDAGGAWYYDAARHATVVTVVDDAPQMHLVATSR